MQTNVQKSYGVSVAIVIAGLLIAGAVVFSGGGNTASTTTADNVGSQPSEKFRMPDETDHVRGNPDATIAIIEFSDLECPFCARIHPTLSQIVEKNDDVKWIYRHFPLSSIHSRALSAAVASECIARLGGNDAFWEFTDEAFVNQRQLGDAWYREQAASFGIDPGAFTSCMNDKSIVADIQTDLSEATNTGGRGTPYVVVVTPSGQLMPFSGALPYAQVSAVIEQARNN
ncbi:MAG: DsbA family protein [Candidatus Zambryskibacteria bacterium]|nr:DsbA family protein [Candidatus Zambryskibacteria bacterium]